MQLLREMTYPREQACMEEDCNGKKALSIERQMQEQVQELLTGLISDTHDNLPMIDKAIQRLNAENVELVLHAGDYVSPFVVPRFKTLKCKLIGIYGNNDGGRELLKAKFSEHKNLEMRGNFAKVMVNDKAIALVHGDDAELLNALIDTQGFDVVVHGHVHTAEICRRGRTLVVNPGEVCGYLSGKSTLALLDSKALEARIVEL